MELVINIPDLKFSSTNGSAKYNRNFSLTKEYRAFRDEIYLNCRKRGRAEKPYVMRIEMVCYHDYDNVLKPIGDALEKTGVIDNDKNLLDVTIKKVIGKKGKPGTLKVWI